VFNADVPPTATPLTLEELRRALKTTEGSELTRAGTTVLAGTEATEGTGQDQHGGTGTRGRLSPPCLRVSVLISSRALRHLPLRGLRPLRSSLA
jgi:hypothetical protein